MDTDGDSKCDVTDEHELNCDGDDDDDFDLPEDEGPGRMWAASKDCDAKTRKKEVEYSRIKARKSKRMLTADDVTETVSYELPIYRLQVTAYMCTCTVDNQRSDTDCDLHLR